MIKFNRLSLKDQELFAKRLAFLISSGTPIVKSLQIIRGQTSVPAQRAIFDRIVDDVSNGQYLSTSLTRFKNIFGAFTINIIRVGETSGTLDQNLKYLTEELKKKRELRSRLVSAFVYPVFITLATLGITMLLISYVFPKVLPIFKSFHAQLPVTTRILLSVSGFFTHYGWFVCIGLMVLCISAVLIIASRPRWLEVFDRFVLAIPIVGTIIRDYQVTNFTRTFGLLLKSEIKLVPALEVIAQTTSNLVYKKEIELTAVAVAKGDKISSQLAKNVYLFPPMLSQMISIGETSGNLTDSLLYLSNYYESEVNEMTKNLSNSLEPILMVIMGLLVGFIAISIITPIYQITQNIHP